MTQRLPSITMAREIIGLRVPLEPIESRLTSQEQLPRYLGDRIQHTLILARNAHYLKFLAGGGNIQVVGAALQDRSHQGGSSFKDAKGRTVYRGLQAAHVRLGSYAQLNGQPIAKAWESRFARLAAALGVQKKEAYASGLEGHGHLAGTSVIFESWTRFQDALINQAFGTIERRCHQELSQLNMPSVPRDEVMLEREMTALSRLFYEVVPRLLCTAALERSVTIQREHHKERCQHRAFYKGHPPIFQKEADLLEFLIAELSSSRGSQTLSHINRDRQSAYRDIAFDMQFVAKAKEESAAAKSS